MQPPAGTPKSYMTKPLLKTKKGGCYQENQADLPTFNAGYVSHRSGWDNQWSRDRHNWVCYAEHE
jgi:hypothetical protein